MNSPQQQHNIERRVFSGEVRASDDADNVIQGTGAVFGVYADMGWHLEVNEAGAGDGADFSECACLFNHNADIVLGRTHNGTLQITMDENGMHYKANKLPDTQAAKDALTLVKGGYVHQSSYAFTIAAEVWKLVDRAELEGVVEKRTLDRVTYQGKVDIRSIQKWGKVYDTSPVTYPAFKETTAYSDNAEIAKRSFQAAMPERARARFEEQETAERSEETPQSIPDWKTEHYRKLTRLREMQAQ